MRKKAERQYRLDFAGTQRLTKEWFTLYCKIDATLNANPQIVDLVHADLEEGNKKAKRNVEGVASETILRMAIVQRAEKLSLRDLIVAIDDSQVLRFFCKFYDDPVISHCQYAKLVNLIQPETWKKINEVIVQFGRKRKKFQEKNLRLDTTAVETDVHYPADSSLLMDCVRVLYRLIGQARKIEPALAGTKRARLRDAKRLAQKIGRGGKTMHKATRKKLYGQLIGVTERARVWGQDMRAKIEARTGAEASSLKGMELQSIANEIAHYVPLVERCVSQARRRVLEEQAVPHAEKLFSIFEPHTELLIRGKAGKDLEFGHMVEVHQIEGKLITDYVVHEKRPVEAPLLEKAITRHTTRFGRPPESCAADRGFYSEEAVRRAAELGVKKVCVPKKGRRTQAEDQREKRPWFKWGQAFRAGIEGAISVLKRVFGLGRCLREGWERFQSWVGAGVLAHNLVLLART